MEILRHVDNALTRASEEISKWKADLAYWEDSTILPAHGVYIGNDNHLRVTGDGLSAAFSLLVLGEVDRFERPAPVVKMTENSVPVLKKNGPALKEAKALETAKSTFASIDNKKWLAAVHHNIALAEKLLAKAQKKREVIAKALSA